MAYNFACPLSACRRVGLTWWARLTPLCRRCWSCIPAQTAPGAKIRAAGGRGLGADVAPLLLIVIVMRLRMITVTEWGLLLCRRVPQFFALDC